MANKARTVRMTGLRKGYGRPSYRGCGPRATLEWSVAPDMSDGDLSATGSDGYCPPAVPEDGMRCDAMHGTGRREEGWGRLPPTKSGGSGPGHAGGPGRPNRPPLRRIPPCARAECRIQFVLLSIPQNPAASVGV